jgi:hypothetical protein
VAGDRRRRAGPRPKTYTRWLRCTLLANGINQDLDREDAEAVAEFLLATGRAVNPQRWVDSFIEAGKLAEFERLY